MTGCMSEFTPGPWALEWMDASMYTGEDIEGKIVVGIYAKIGKKKEYIWRESFDHIQNKDACLIAAAPDMYEALKALRALVGATESDRLCLYEYARKQADAAIAKAEGKP